jgi:hypothetical protein
MHDATLIRHLAAVRAAAQPALASRCDKAVALVLTGKVHLAGATHALVDSYKDPGVQYTVNGTCACPDALHKAPEGWCAHKIAVDLVRACPPEAVAAACPEAAFSITLKGRLGGHAVLLTARGQTWEAFSTNVARLTGLLDAVPGPAAPRTREPGEEAPRVCPKHGITLKPSTFEAGTLFCPKRNDDGKYCTERWPAKGQKR